MLAKVMIFSSGYMAIPGNDNRMFHKYIAYSTFHGLPVSASRELGREDYYLLSGYIGYRDSGIFTSESWLYH